MLRRNNKNTKNNVSYQEITAKNKDEYAMERDSQRAGQRVFHSSTDSSLHKSPTLISTKVILFISTTGMIISLLTGPHNIHLDLFGTGAFIFACIISHPPSPLPPLHRCQLSATAIIIWATKLAFFLFYRALVHRRDDRLTSTLSSFWGVVFYWVVSATWGVVTMLPHSLGLLSRSDGTMFSNLGGGILFFIGFAMETIADYQKWIHKISASDDGRVAFCNVGLWRLSQHPNFFGNILLWCGIFLMNYPGLVDNRGTSGDIRGWRQWKKICLASLSPLFLCCVFYLQAVGIMTNAKEMAQAKYGWDPEYQTYVESVPLIIPTLRLS